MISVPSAESDSYMLSWQYRDFYRSQFCGYILNAGHEPSASARRLHAGVMHSIRFRPMTADLAYPNAVGHEEFLEGHKYFFRQGLSHRSSEPHLLGLTGQFPALIIVSCLINANEPMMDMGGSNREDNS